MNRETLLDTIRRLLALSEKNPNEHEAQLAAAKAAELMRRHQIDAAQVEASQQEWVMECVEQYRRVPFEARVVGELVAKHFLVEAFTDTGERPVTGRTKILLFGRPENVAVARYTYHVLLRVFRELANRNLGLSTSTAFKNYCVGLAAGFSAAILRQRKEVALQVARQEDAIIEQHRADLARAFAKRHGEPGKPRVDRIETDLEAYYLGRHDGEQIQLNTPLPAGPTAAPRRIGVS